VNEASDDEQIETEQVDEPVTAELSFQEETQQENGAEELVYMIDGVVCK
jgi:hypothetical protein